MLLSLAFTYFLNPWWLTLAGFVGVNLIQSAFTSFCFVETFLRKLRYRVESHAEARTHTSAQDEVKGAGIDGTYEMHSW